MPYSNAAAKLERNEELRPLRSAAFAVWCSCCRGERSRKARVHGRQCWPPLAGWGQR